MPYTGYRGLSTKFWPQTEDFGALPPPPPPPNTAGVLGGGGGGGGGGRAPKLSVCGQTSTKQGDAPPPLPPFTNPPLYVLGDFNVHL